MMPLQTHSRKKQQQAIQCKLIDLHKIHLSSKNCKIELIDKIVCIMSSCVHPEVTDDEIEQMLAKIYEEESKRALEEMFGSIETDADANADDIGTKRKILASLTIKFSQI